jgi:hypothetical protein
MWPPPVFSSFFLTVFTAALVDDDFRVRSRFSGGELGGSTATKWFHFTILVALWCLYLTLSTLKVRPSIHHPSIALARTCALCCAVDRRHVWQAYDKLGSSQKASRCSNE